MTLQSGHRTYSASAMHHRDDPQHMQSAGVTFPAWYAHHVSLEPRSGAYTPGAISTSISLVVVLFLPTLVLLHRLLDETDRTGGAGGRSAREDEPVASLASCGGGGCAETDR